MADNEEGRKKQPVYYTKKGAPRKKIAGAWDEANEIERQREAQREADELRRIQLEGARTAQEEREREAELEKRRAYDEALEEDRRINEQRRREQSVGGRIGKKVEGAKEAYHAKKDAFVNQAINLTVKTFTSRRFLAIFLISILVFLALVWWFNWWSYVFAYFFTIVAFFMFLLIIAWGLFFDKNPYSKWIAVALFIWGIDLVPAGFPLLGQPYAGFEFNLRGILQTDWIAVGTSTLFLLLIFADWVFNLVEKKYLAAAIGFALMIMINRTVSYFGYQLRFQIPYGNHIFGIGLLLLLFLAFKFRKESQDPDFFNFPTFLLMALVFSFFFSVNTGWMKNIRAWAHVVFILSFGLAYIRKKEKDNPGLWHILIPGLLLADFYLYNLAWIVNNDIEGLKFIPLLVFFVIIYCLAREEENAYGVVSLLFIVILFFIFLVLPTPAFASTSIEFKAKEGADYKDFFKEFSDSVRKAIVGRLDIAAGGYLGTVEQNRYESLGVYFANVRAADPRFYNDEAITIWGTIRSKTYKDAVIVDFKCNRWKDNERIIADKIVPDVKFPIFTLEEIDTECTFLPKDLESEYTIKPGSNTVTLTAEYNFQTDAYQKAYFIDRERFKAYSRENIDPLGEFGIKDKNPAAVFTNGPVEIGMEAGPLITVSEGYPIKPTVGITLRNRKEIQDKDKNIISRWDGKIRKITELILLLPPGIEIPKDDLDKCKSKDKDERLRCPCNMPFTQYNISSCRISCNNHVRLPCNEICYSSQSNNQKCIEECSNSFEKCIQECGSLFEVGEGEGPKKEKYNAYALDVDSIQFKDLNKDIDKHRSFLCRFETKQSVLDATPITTRYFRARARYNYLLENSVQINVEATPIPIFPSGRESEVPIFISEIPDQKYLELYFDSTVENEVKYSPIVLKYAKQYNVDYLFVKAIIQRESEWNPNAYRAEPKINDASYGLMQVLAGTAKGTNCNADFNTNTESNIDCGVKYLRSLIDYQSKNNLKKGMNHIAAGYNGGPTKMRYSTNLGHEEEAVWEDTTITEHGDVREYVGHITRNYDILVEKLID